MMDHGASAQETDGAVRGIAEALVCEVPSISTTLECTCTVHTVYSAVRDLDATCAVRTSLLYLDGTPALKLMAVKGVLDTGPGSEVVLGSFVMGAA